MSALSLSSNEFCILNLLWSESRAMTRPEILEALPDKDWNPNSIHLILNNMIKKGVLQVVGVARCGRGYGRTYAPTLSQTESRRCPGSGGYPGYDGQRPAAGRGRCSGR
ncbi:MAG: BlaI/MecI/CopY family transcriptional regulator [Oscillospiraceae bacterium]